MKILRTFGIVAVVVALFAIIATNVSSQNSPKGQVWNQATTTGNLEANNYYIMYTDLFCPYCAYFARPVMEHWDEFQEYLAEHDILFEVRLTDYIYESVGSQYSKDSAEAAYCAARENKFWEFYHGAVQALWDDYQSKGIGNSKTAPAIKNLPEDYWLKIGHKAGLGEDFDRCVANRETAEEVSYNTRRALQVANGMPSFKFNKFTTAGFDSSWGWDYVKLYLDAGLKK